MPCVFSESVSVAQWRETGGSKDRGHTILGSYFSSLDQRGWWLPQDGGELASLCFLFH